MHGPASRRTRRLALGALLLLLVAGSAAALGLAAPEPHLPAAPDGAASLAGTDEGAVDAAAPAAGPADAVQEAADAAATTTADAAEARARDALARATPERLPHGGTVRLVFTVQAPETPTLARDERAACTLVGPDGAIWGACPEQGTPLRLDATDGDARTYEWRLTGFNAAGAYTAHFTLTQADATGARDTIATATSTFHVAAAAAPSGATDGAGPEAWSERALDALQNGWRVLALALGAGLMTAALLGVLARRRGPAHAHEAPATLAPLATPRPLATFDRVERPRAPAPVGPAAMTALPPDATPMYAPRPRAPRTPARLPAARTSRRGPDPMTALRFVLAVEARKRRRSA